MKAFFKGVLFAIGLTLGAHSLLAAPTANDWIDQYFKAKLGRNSPAEDARLQAERATTAFRVETPLPAAAPSWVERYHKAKLGRYSRAEEARLRELGTAFREEPGAGPAALTWTEQYIKGKLGRSPER